MLALLAGLSFPTSGPHPNSVSRTEITVEGERATVRLTFQALSLIEVIPELDLVPDARLDAEEIAEGRAVIEEYLRANVRLLQGEGEREAALPATVESLVPQDPGLVDPMDLQEVQASLSFQATAPLEVLTVDSHLFHETNPWHKDLATLAWNGAAPVPHTFEGAETRWRFEPAHVRRPGVFTGFVRIGAEHVLELDHLAFLLALFVAARALLALLALIGAGTVLHALTLTAAARGWVELSPRFVDLAVALAVAYVACETLLRKSARDPWIEGLGIGALHGLGFIALLADPLAGEPLVGTAIAGFHVGFLLAQVTLVLGAALLVRLALRVSKRQGNAGAEPELVPRPLRLAGSAVAGLIGFALFVKRAGWLG